MERDALEHFDVIIVGAGLSGVAAACYLQRRCADHKYVVLEGRAATGGTWDLFRYPGVRSDSDMFTLGYTFRPWRGSKAIAEGAEILDYVRDTAEENDIDRHIRLNHQVRSATWSTRDARWSVEVLIGDSGDCARFTCKFLFLCTGYYSYSAGHAPRLPGSENFRGGWIHPQLWPRDLDYSGKRVVVIGSGATAITLVPTLAKTAAHVTMLQRSPTYLMSMPSEDAIARRLRLFLPDKVASRLTRWKNIVLQQLFYSHARKQPAKVKAAMVAYLRKQLGPACDVDKHFTPRYEPWDQRPGLTPDGDLLVAIKDARAGVVTDEIVDFTAQGCKLKSGDFLPADIIVCATGLDIRVAGGIQLSVDGKKVDLSKTVIYKGMFGSSIPNLTFCLGYPNASWTLKVDFTCRYVCRVLRYMKRHRRDICVVSYDSETDEPIFSELTSGFLKRAQHLLPRQGRFKPWRLNQNYLLDLLELRFGRVNDGTMRFSNAQDVE